MPLNSEEHTFEYGCTIKRVKSLFAGEATEKRLDGADWYLKYNGSLTEYYISKIDAKKLGWKRNEKKLSDIAPSFMMYGGAYKNNNGHLPEKQNRKWYKADIDYSSGNRNSKRILFSNDGLIFVTYDHYKTFVEIR